VPSLLSGPPQQKLNQKIWTLESPQGSPWIWMSMGFLELVAVEVTRMADDKGSWI